MNGFHNDDTDPTTYDGDEIAAKENDINSKDDTLDPGSTPDSGADAAKENDMNNNNDDTSTAPEADHSDEQRPLGFWLRLVDHHLTAAFDAEFGDEGFDRRAWIVLNLLSGEMGDAALARLSKIESKRGGKLLRRLEDDGLIARTDDSWALTDAGRAQRDAMKDRVDAIRARVLGAVSEEEFEALIGSLKKIAREFGWDGSGRMPRGRGFGPRGFGRRGFGPGFRPGFGPGFGGFGRGGGFGPGGFGPDSEDRPRPFDGERGNAHRGFGPGEGPRRGRHDHDDAHRPEFRGEYPGSGHRHERGQGCGHGEHSHEHRRGFGGERGSGERGSGERGFGGHERGRGGASRSAERAFERGFEAGAAAASRMSAGPQV
ncbi:MarR family winged helix-turn-helix transcriptional regulator [Microbacterium sp. 1P10UB]|uniref:MarR family winged helix-turn-helix transcriptional regulator n=1 Tax=unclassified Microbacterium TaxID=2609290 RepID=UPI0039A02DBE